MSPAILSNTTGKGEQEPQRSQTLMTTCVQRVLGALHCCSLSLAAARGVVLLSAPFTDQKTEARGGVTTKATLLGVKARGSELSPLRFVLFPLCSKLSSSLPYCSGRS